MFIDLNYLNHEQNVSFVWIACFNYDRFDKYVPLKEEMFKNN